MSPRPAPEGGGWWCPAGRQPRTETALLADNPDQQLTTPPTQLPNVRWATKRARRDRVNAVYDFTKDAANQAGIGGPIGTVGYEAHHGEPPSIRFGRSFRVPEHAVHEYLREAVADRLACNTNG